MTTETPMHRDNAYLFSDNFCIMSHDGISFYGCEHNQQEAEAIAKWITNSTGRKTEVRKNRPDQVTRSKELRGSEPLLYQLREEALVEMGVWAKPVRRRAKQK